MSNQRYSPEFKDEAVRQIVDRGYSVADTWSIAASSGKPLRNPLRREQNDPEPVRAPPKP